MLLPAGAILHPLGSSVTPPPCTPGHRGADDAGCCAAMRMPARASATQRTAAVAYERYLESMSTILIAAQSRERIVAEETPAGGLARRNGASTARTLRRPITSRRRCGRSTRHRSLRRSEPARFDRRIDRNLRTRGVVVRPVIDG